MGYLNKATITVDAILTNRGRELLAMGGVGTSGFNITKFAVADDEIDYTLYNTQLANTQNYGNVIENMPLLEATPDESQIMRYKLVTLDSGDFSSAFIAADGTITIPQILNFGIGGTISVSDTSTPRITVETNPPIPETATAKENYTLIVANGRLVKIQNDATGEWLNPPAKLNANGSITIKFDAKTTLKFSKIKAGTTSATVFGDTTGATATATITVS